MLSIGDAAPDFRLTSDQNQPVSLQDLRGKKVILFFYPKDNTPGCTREACDFRDAMSRLTALNTAVYGISRDNVTKHQKFKEKYSLSFPLLVDENGDICQAYGVLDKKSLFGNTFLGITRSTFLIDEKGVIRAIWRKVKVNGHVDQVFNELKGLSE